MKYSYSQDAGLTTLQAMVSLAIIGVLVYFALPYWGQLVLRAQRMSCQSNQRGIIEAIAVAREDRNVPAVVGFFDAPLEAAHGWGAILIPDYLSHAPACPAECGSSYNMSPLGLIWSDKGAGQYTWVNQGLANDHRLVK